MPRIITIYICPVYLLFILVSYNLFMCYYL
nr:MAG TPA: protein of unknown function UPF0697 [Herelleviridae sp.]